MRSSSCASTACLLATLLACAAAPAAAAGRRLQQQAVPATNVVVHDGTHRILWDLAYVPYERLQARCGELVQFRWSDPSGDSEGQTVALLNATSSEDALARCSEAEPLTPPAQTGEYTEELLTEGTFYFVEPSNCDRGQILVVEVSCAPQPDQPEEVAASGNTGGSRPRGWSRGGTDASTARANAAAVGAPAPAPSAEEAAAADGAAVTAAPAPAPAAAA
ncbi:hypothetical protein C2E21_7585 isoform B [Chlorella sorokiniana]|uniref:Uncharacterized protein n=1 Tax=Chlorella sorokiniana TaxID=3076 RepID=A0A2P6THI1_CHLSO|nr:hypothetical protein C2E21_7585 isoform B [Chlorella sorokiniana]|eukprot:PRW33742.1 hypothetical protein C2E21_7585 isoform B [Chlorella sorokiniana]